MFQTYSVGDFTEFMVVGDMVFKFPARLKGYRVYDKMIMDIVCIKVCGNNNFILVSPHTHCCFQPDFVRFFGRGFAGLEALVAVVCHVAAHFPEAFFRCRHTLIRPLCVAVDAADIHTLVGLFAIGNISQGGV